jgi:hypothetical protein
VEDVDAELKVKVKVEGGGAGLSRKGREFGVGLHGVVEVEGDGAGGMELCCKS